MNNVCCTNAAEKYCQIYDRKQWRYKKERKRDLHRIAVEKNRTSLINTVLSEFLDGIAKMSTNEGIYK